MELKQYLEMLNNLVKSKPECLKMTVVSSSDDEGNSFSKVIYSPSMGLFIDNEFETDGKHKGINNAVCIN